MTDPLHPAEAEGPADIVERATQALHSAPIPDGPSAELMEATRRSLHGAARMPQAGNLFLLRLPMLRLAAALVIFGAAGLIIYRSLHHSTPGTSPGKTDIVRKPEPSTAPTDPKHEPPHVEPPPAPIVEVNPPPVPVQPAPVVADRTITGQVLFAGAVPVPQRLEGAESMPECAKLHGGAFYDESVAVGPESGLANVVVSVSGGLSGWLPEEFPPPAEPAVLDQKGCVFLPHVVPVMVGQPLVIKNSDPVAHNVQLMAVNNPRANLGQPPIGENETEKFQLPEVFRVKCDMHPWMTAWVRVVDNPFFAVTDAHGRFSIKGLPPGTYTLKAWHEQLGVKEMQVTIAPGQGARVEFTFRQL